MNAFGWDGPGVSRVIEHLTEEMRLCQLGMLRREQPRPEEVLTFLECSPKDTVYQEALAFQSGKHFLKNKNIKAKKSHLESIKRNLGAGIIYPLGSFLFVKFISF